MKVGLEIQSSSIQNTLWQLSFAGDVLPEVSRVASGYSLNLGSPGE